MDEIPTSMAWNRLFEPITGFIYGINYIRINVCYNRANDGSGLVYRIKWCFKRHYRGIYDTVSWLYIVSIWYSDFIFQAETSFNFEETKNLIKDGDWPRFGLRFGDQGELQKRL